MSYAGNVYPFVQDGSFLYYGGLNEPGLALAIDAQGEAALYGHDPTIDDVIWEGRASSLKDRADLVGIARTSAPDDLEADVVDARTSGQRIHTLPPYRGDTRLRL